MQDYDEMKIKEQYKVFADMLKENNMTIAIIEYSDDTIAHLFRESETPEVLKGADVVQMDETMLQELPQDISSGELAGLLSEMAMKKYGADVSLGVTDDAYAIAYRDETEDEDAIHATIAEEIYHAFFWMMHEKGVFAERIEEEYQEKVLSEITADGNKEEEPPSEIEIVAKYVIKEYFKNNLPEDAMFRCGYSERFSCKKTQRNLKDTFACDTIKKMASYIADRDALEEEERTLAEEALKIACKKTPTILGVRYKLKDYLD